MPNDSASQICLTFRGTACARDAHLAITVRRQVNITADAEFYFQHGVSKANLTGKYLRRVHSWRENANCRAFFQADIFCALVPRMQKAIGY
jgi:hypothetical protein